MSVAFEKWHRGENRNIWHLVTVAQMLCCVEMQSNVAEKGHNRKVH